MEEQQPSLVFGCLRHFEKEDVLERHKLYCRRVETTGQVLLIPDPNSKVKIENESYAETPLGNINFTLIRHLLSFWNRFASHISMLLIADTLQ